MNPSCYDQLARVQAKLRQIQQRPLKKRPFLF